MIGVKIRRGLMPCLFSWLSFSKESGFPTCPRTDWAKSMILGNRFTCFSQVSISLRIPKMFSPVRGCQMTGRSRAFIGIPPCVDVFKRICVVKNKGRTDKTLRVFLQHKNKVYLFARSLKVRGFVLFSPPALGFLCGLSQYGFCQF